MSFYSRYGGASVPTAGNQTNAPSIPVGVDAATLNKLIAQPRVTTAAVDMSNVEQPVTIAPQQRNQYPDTDYSGPSFLDTYGQYLWIGGALLGVVVLFAGWKMRKSSMSGYRRRRRSRR